MTPPRSATARRRRPGGPPRIDPKQQHLAWLSLIEVTGPFLTLPVLVDTWHTLDGLEKDARDKLRFQHGLWQTDTAKQQKEWIEYLLRDLLEWGDALDLAPARLSALALDVTEHETHIVPDFVLNTPGAKAKAAPELLGMICPDATRPTARIKDSAWSATPVDRMAHLCRHHGVQLGLVTDGRWWALVWAPRHGVTTTAVFDTISWPEQAEHEVIRAFRSLLRRSRFFGVPDGEKLTALLDESTRTQEDVTDALGVQVRQAVELLVDAIGRADAGIDAMDAYRGAVVVMMRLVFLLFAEERGLLPADNAIYADAYSAGGLYDHLEQQARDSGEPALRYSTAAWHRLVALFNAVFYGVDHPQLPMPAYDGSLFDPQTYPWLGAGLAIDDQTVLHMLNSVQYVEIGTGKAKERRRLSFRALDVEQIGYVYEGLLSFDGVRAVDTVIGLTGKAGQEAEAPLAELEALARPFVGGKGRRVVNAAGLAAKLAEMYKSYGIGTANALARKLAPLTEADREIALGRLASATDGDRALAERILPFYPIIRTDLRDLPVVILPGTIYVTDSRLRKNTGTHYTPRFLAEQIVEGALQPLMYEVGPLQTANEEKWIPKSSERILQLKVADIAMGSAAFLVAACRYMANFLVDAWSREGDEQARAVVDSNLTTTEAAADAEADPVVIKARRLIIEHCLDGCDINPAAVEMAKLSLWLVSMDPHRPFTFLDDHLVSGDALLGITSLDQLEWMDTDPEAGRALHGPLAFASDVRARVHEAAEDRIRLADMEGDTLEHLTDKQTLFAEAQEKTEEFELFADLVAGAALAGAVKNGSVPRDRFEGRDDAAVGGKRHLFMEAADATEGAATHDSRGVEAARELAERWLETDHPAGGFDRTPVHWPLVFPEVFENGGFDAVIGNPPFLGGKKISGVSGSAYREYLVEAIAGGVKGNADLIAYFLLRAHDLLNSSGQTGIIATNTLAQGDTREVGLDQLVPDRVEIRQAVKSEKWPSRTAVLEYCAVWTSRAVVDRRALRLVDGIPARGITSSLDPASRVTSVPKRLIQSSGVAFIGNLVNGIGFAMSNEEAESLRAIEPKCVDILRRYLNGEDLNSQPDSSASRWIIDFHDWPLARASHYPYCLDRVRQLVKPARDRLSDSKKSVRERWWQYEKLAPGLTAAIAELDRVIVITLVSKVVMPVMVPTGQVFSHMLGVFASDDPALLAFLSSAPHYWWAIDRASTLETRVRYTPTDVFETLARPALTAKMRALGDRLDTFRRQLMLSRNIGLTVTYNLVHDPECTDADIVKLREIHRRIDEAVFRAYGWRDLIEQGLDHGHHETRQGIRYTIGPAVRVEMLDRLRELNKERYEAEVAAGLHDNRKRAARAKSPAVRRRKAQYA